MFDYPVELSFDDNGTVLATVPDLPGAVTFGDDREDALARAGDAIETILQALIAGRQEIPPASPPGERATAAPGLLATLKASIYLAMRARGWRKADLARAMAVDVRQVDRLLDLRHGSTVTQLEAALAICGRRADVSIVALQAA